MAKPNRKQQPAQDTNEAQTKDLPGQAVDLQEEAIPEVVTANETTNETTNEAPTMTPEELIALYGNKSNAIRALSANGKTRSEVAKLLNIRYQHVNNVLGQVLKRPIKAAREAEKANGTTEQ